MSPLVRLSFLLFVRAVLPEGAQEASSGESLWSLAVSRYENHLMCSVSLCGMILLCLRQCLLQLPRRLTVVLQAKKFIGDAQASLLREPLADGTLVATPEIPSDDIIPSLLTLSDVMGAGWFAADAANVKSGATVAVVGYGAVGLLGVLSAKQMAPGGSSQ